MADQKHKDSVDMSDKFVTEADIHHRPLKEDVSDIGAGKDDTQSMRRSSRSRTLTVKGLQYVMWTKGKRRQDSYKVLQKKTEYIKSLMIEEISAEEMQMLYSHWMTMYEHFLDNHEDYSSLLTLEEKTKDSAEWFRERELFLLSFKDEMEKWLFQAKSNALETKFDSTRIQFKNLVHPEDSVSQASESCISSQKSQRSRTSQQSHRSSISSARLQQEQEKAELKLKMASLKRRQSLEEAKLKLKIEEEQLELQSKMDIAEAKSKVIDRHEEIESGRRYYSQSQRQTSTKVPSVRFAGDERFESQSSIRPETDSDTHMKYLHHATSQLNPNVRPFYPSKDTYPNIDHGARSSRIRDHEGSDISSASRTSTEEAVLSIVKHLKKPIAEIETFSGDPLQYKKFIRQFNSKVVTNTDDDDERMNYLEQYTSGDANKIVTCYSYLNAKQGYKAALKELDERYGDVNVIVNAYVQKALNWPIIKGDNAKALDQYAIFLGECECAIESIEAIKVLEYPENLKKMVSKLPYYLHDKWRNIVQECKDKGELVKLSKLVKFVKREAKKATDPTYGKDAMTIASPGTKGNTQRKSGRNPGSFATKDVKTGNNKVTAYASDPSQQSSSPSKDNTPSTNTRNNTDKTCLYCKNSSHPVRHFINYHMRKNQNS